MAPLRISKTLKVIFILTLTLSLGCKDSYNPVEGHADFWIENIESDPRYKALTAPNNAMTFTGGVGGVLVMRTKYEQAIDDFSAFDRACPYEYEQGEVVSVNWDGNDPFYATCPKCDSKYNLIGRVVESGPSGYPLYTYDCDYYGGNIHVY